MTPQSDAQEPSKAPSFADTSQRLSDMITGFRLSQMIYVTTKLGIPDLLKNEALTVDALAQATGTHAPSLYRVLRALASVGIFAEDEQSRFAITPLAQQLQAGVPGSQRAKVLVFGEPSRWRSWGEMLYSVTTGEPAFPHLYGMDSWEYVGRDPELNATFNDYMTANTTPQTAAIVE